MTDTYLYYDLVGPHTRDKYKEKYGRDFLCMYPDCTSLVTKTWFRIDQPKPEDEDQSPIYACIGASCNKDLHIPHPDSEVAG